MPVHLLGNPCNIDKIKKIAKKYNLWLIEDVADQVEQNIMEKKLDHSVIMQLLVFSHTL